MDKDFQNAINCFKIYLKPLKPLKEVGDREGEGKAYGNLGNPYDSLGDFQKAIEYHERGLKISTEVRDRAREKIAYYNLDNAYDSLEDFQKAIESYERDLKISKEVGDRAGEGKAYANLGDAYNSLGDFQKAIDHHTKMASNTADDWRSMAFRQKVVSQIEEAVKKSGNPNVMMKNPSEIENRVYLKAETKVEYLSYVFHLLKYIRVSRGPTAPGQQQSQEQEVGAMGGTQNTA